MKKSLKEIMNSYNLYSNLLLKEFIYDNPENLTLNELSIVSELSNANRTSTAAYYTDKETTELIFDKLPDIDKETIHILEPSVGIGNFLDIIIKKYREKEKVIIDTIDIDENSIDVLKLLNTYRHIPDNIEIRFVIDDFLKTNIDKRYDLIIGNPPFLKKNKIEEWKLFANKYDDHISTNLSSFFLQKALEIADNIVMVMPKYFLSNGDFCIAREKCENNAIDYIIDFGEKGFKGVLIETICLFINTVRNPAKTEAISVTRGLSNIILQSKMIDKKFPNWLLYRDEFFDDLAKKIEFDVFDVYRDREITTKLLNNNDGVRVLKSRNIARDGSSIIDIEGYDSFINENQLSKLSVSKFRFNTEVFLVPNMTYYPRIIQKPYNCIMNGSVAILSNKTSRSITKKNLRFLNSTTFTRFYSIARNFSTRSLNIDKNSVQYFGLYKGEMK
ncbi:Eco57I restriction-modification methylase domain-containing protein [Staphylococcus xylosus]|uniref:Eco57I restriction-modification methylase domain-containing protein n=1 Tax=Staphylococcus xylosus TaxID=1288 RepID=UPI002DB7B4D5|nr:N-6 DNA methylase [Staphylococcus xylosus]MEB7811349.1 Eco57I restriction-modification methylase domain-containing protein [Staphylococcus xylosus]